MIFFCETSEFSGWFSWSDWISMFKCSKQKLYFLFIFHSVLEWKWFHISCWSNDFVNNKIKNSSGNGWNCFGVSKLQVWKRIIIEIKDVRKQALIDYNFITFQTSQRICFINFGDRSFYCDWIEKWFWLLLFDWFLDLLNFLRNELFRLYFMNTLTWMFILTWKSWCTSNIRVIFIFIYWLKIRLCLFLYIFIFLIFFFNVVMVHFLGIDSKWVHFWLLHNLIVIISERTYKRANL